MSKMKRGKEDSREGCTESILVHYVVHTVPKCSEYVCHYVSEMDYSQIRALTHTHTLTHLSIAWLADKSVALDECTARWRHQTSLVFLVKISLHPQALTHTHTLAHTHPLSSMMTVSLSAASPSENCSEFHTKRHISTLFLRNALPETHLRIIPAVSQENHIALS